MDKLKLNKLALNVDSIVKDTDLVEDKVYISGVLKNLERNDGLGKDERIVINNFINIINKCESSLVKREAQLVSDAVIVNKINGGIDLFREGSKFNIESTIREINKVIESELQNYKNEIINRLDPYKIAEFKTQSDFEYWLEAVNDNYITIFNKKIGRQVDLAIKKYTYEVEKVITELDGYLSSRENYIELEDEVYGSLSKSKNAIVKSTKNDLILYCETGKNLTEASVELYQGVVAAKGKYDKKVEIANVAGASAGAIPGTIIATAGVYATIGAIGGPPGVLFSSIVGALIGTATAIIGSLAVGNISKAIAEGKLEKGMLKEIEECRIKFAKQVESIQLDMNDKIKLQITTTFDNEIIAMEKSFMQFRMIVNIDNERVDMLKSTVLETRDLIENLESN